MKKQNLSTFLKLALFSLLVGCSRGTYAEEAADTFSETPTYEELFIFTQNEGHTFAPLEPVHNVHLGAFLNFDGSPMSEHIEDFEARTGREHSLYTYEFMLGTPPSSLWLLEMVSKGRIPNLIVTHGNLLDPFDRDALLELPKTWGGITYRCFFISSPRRAVLIMM